MSTNSDLAGWGEPPVTPAEEALGTLLDKVLAGIERGQPVRPESLRADRPELLERGQELVRTVGLLCECAASVWEHSRPPDEDPGEGADPVQKTPGAQPGGLPDPFPGEFRIRRLLGEGTFGKVWLADDLKLGRQVALKTLKLPATSTLGPQVLAALRKEAQHLARLEHPNIVRVHAWLEAGGEYFLVLQFVAGGSLADRLKEKKALSWQDAARYVADVGEALVEAHRRGVVHRDVKPDNILWDATRDEALLTDFGVSARLAEPGTVAGTPVYMAPEAFDGVVSPALDVYGLAATFYRLATGKLPFASASVPDLVRQKLRGLPETDPSCQAIPEELERVIRAGLAGKAEDRPGMADFTAALRGSLNRVLADALVPEGGSQAPVNLRLVVSRRVGEDAYETVATTKAASGTLSRDMKKVPRPPEQVRLRTGDRVRIEVVADRPGYVTVFNIGPGGNLNLLYPEEPAATPPPLPANTPLQVVDVEMTPPVGRERLFALWGESPQTLQPSQLLGLVAGAESGSGPYRATRDMKRVQQQLTQRRPEQWTVTVLELEHLPQGTGPAVGPGDHRPA